MLTNHDIKFPQMEEAYTFFTSDGWIDCLSEEKQEAFAKYFEK
jgi:hypothetical protein